MTGVDAIGAEPRTPAGDGDARVAALLSPCLVFQAVGAPARAALVSRARRRTYLARETVFAMGDPGASLMIVLSGRVRISLPSADGKTILLAELSAGAVFGEIALIDGRPRSADATAASNCELLVCERRDVLPFLEGDWETCFRLLKLLCGRLRSADGRLADVAFVDLAGRVAKELLERAGARPPGGGPARVAVTQGQLAGAVGATRESVNRRVSEWRRAGVVGMDKGAIVLLRPDALQRIASGGIVEG